MKIQPCGLGAWIAFRSNVGNAKYTAKLLKDLGFKWVAPRLGDSALNDSSFRITDIDEYHKQGLRVYPWIYSRHASWSREIEGYKKVLSANPEGFIVNAEVHWCIGNAAERTRKANAYVKEMRESFPDLWIAHAPMDCVDYHPDFPYIEFSQFDMVMPQVYAWEHNDQGHAFWLEKTNKQWEAFEKRHKITTPRAPIGCCYRPEGRGGKKLLPLSIDWLKDLDPILSLASDACPSSLYSLDSMPFGLRELMKTRNNPYLEDSKQ